MKNQKIKNIDAEELDSQQMSLDEFIEIQKESDADENEVKDNSPTTEEKSNDLSVRNIPINNLIKNPKNGEDITHTEELELSIRENGFTTPLAVVEAEDGKFMIVSGHRRYEAACKLGLNTLPCIVFAFGTEEEMINHMLLSQSFRDSSKDPLLYARRWIMNEEYLKRIGFKGSFHTEIARRLGLSLEQADRYGSMKKIVRPVWELIQEEKTTVTAVQVLASHSNEEQLEIKDLMIKAFESGENLTIAKVRSIVKRYDKDKKEREKSENAETVDSDVGEELHNEEAHQLQEASHEQGILDNPDDFDECEDEDDFDEYEDEDDFDDYEDEDDLEECEGGASEEAERWLENQLQVLNDVKDWCSLEDKNILQNKSDIKKLLSAMSSLTGSLIEEMKYIVEENNLQEYFQARLDYLEDLIVAE